MAKRRASRNPKRSRRRKGRSEPLLGLQTFPDHLVHEILLWGRPDDEDQSIWLWLCRMSATCVAFRRVIRSVNPGVLPLTPTVFKLVTNNQYLNVGLQQAAQSHAPVRANLMDTIRRTRWMGAMIQRIAAYKDSGDDAVEGPESMDIAVALKRLLTVKGRLPSLTQVHLISPRRIAPDVFDATFLYKMAEMHPRLRSLSLFEVLCSQRPGYPLSDDFGRLSALLPYLQHFGIGGVPWLKIDQIVDFCQYAASNLRIVAVDYHSTRPEYLYFFTRFHEYFRGNLKTFSFQGMQLHSNLMNVIFGANENLSHVDLNYTVGHSDGDAIDAFLEHKPKLQTFRVHGCKWVSNEGLMRFINSHIGAYGGQGVRLRTLGICDTRVTPDGLRAVLTRWTEMTNASLVVEIFKDDPAWDSTWQPLAEEFPGTIFKDAKFHVADQVPY